MSANRWSVGLYRGSLRPDDVRAHEAWLGRPIETVLEMIPRDSWERISKPATQIRAWHGLPYDVVFTTPMLPPTGATLAAGARGDYDERWRTFARTFVAEGRPDAVIRLGHEFNHTWYPWTATGGREAAFAEYFRRIVDATRSVPGSELRFTWNVLSNATGADVEAAYPGDAYVDHIGLDLYDGVRNVTDFEARWQRLRTQAYGLDWLVEFAAERGKPMAFDEWALVKSSSPSCRDPRGDSGDDTVFVNRMIDFFETENVAYANYFDVETTYGCTNSRIMNGPYPNATAAYKRRLLATNRGASSAPTVPSAPVRASIPASDEFDDPALDLGRWTFRSPVSGERPSVGSGRLGLTATSAMHDVRPGGDFSVRVTQPAGSSSFTAEVRFASTPTAPGTWHGITATVGGSTLRYAIRAVDGRLRMVGDVVSATGRVAVTDRAVPIDAGAWVLRVERSGSTFAMSWSTDGRVFADRVSTTVAGPVSAVGPAVGNAATGAPPVGVRALVDYARFTSAP